ncbi:MAG: DNA polymerase, partial [Bacteroidota bacterium]
DSMENLLDHADEIKGKNQERLKEFREQALTSKILATIDINVPIEFNPEAYVIEDFDREHLTDIFRDLEFRSLANEILGKKEAPAPGQQGSLFGSSTAPASAPQRSFKAPPAHAIADHNFGNTEHSYHKAETPEERAALITRLADQQVFAFDTETTGLDATAAELVGIAFSWQEAEAWYVPIPEDRAEAEAIVAEFAAVFADPETEKVGQNIKYDLKMLERYGAPVGGKLLDTMVMHYLLHPDKRHKMDLLSEEYLNYKPVPIETLIGKGKKQLSMRQVPIDKVVDYACEDADITLRLYHALWPELEEEGLVELYETIEAPLIQVLKNIELEGVNLDVDFLENYSKVLTEQLRTNEQEIYDEAGSPFNIGSPKQIGEILFNRMEIPYTGKKTKTGQYKTDEATLTDLAAGHSIVKKILRYRTLSKLLRTYVDALPNLVNPGTSRVHSSFNQPVAATGRLSSSNPNLQNIPMRTPEGAEIRKAFVPGNRLCPNALGVCGPRTLFLK